MQNTEDLITMKTYGSLSLPIFKDRNLLDNISPENIKAVVNKWKSVLSTFEDTHNIFRNAYKDFLFFFNCPENYHPEMLGPFSEISSSDTGDIIVSSMDNVSGLSDLKVALISNTFINDVIIKYQDHIVLHLKQNDSKTKVISFIPGTWLDSVMPYLENTLHQHVVDILDTHTMGEKAIELKEYQQWQTKYEGFTSAYMETDAQLLEISSALALNTQYQHLADLKSNWKDAYQKFFSEHIFNKSFLLSVAQNMNTVKASQLSINTFKSLTIEYPTKSQKNTVIKNDNTNSSLSLKYHYSLDSDNNVFDKYNQDICVYDGDILVLELNLKDEQLDISRVLPGPWIDSFVDLFNVDLLKYHMELNKNTNTVDYNAIALSSFE